MRTILGVLAAVILLLSASMLLLRPRYPDLITQVANLTAVADMPSAANTADSSVASPLPQLPNSQYAVVTRVIDGDTIVVNGNTTIRLVGIDTPETVDPNRPVGCYGKEASDFMKHLLPNQTVFLSKDVSEADKYGRLLRFVYLQTNNGLVFVNDYLVRQGYARAYTIAPDVAKQTEFLQAQAEARINNRGLWSVCQGK